jgi:hypothetical protein
MGRFTFATFGSLVVVAAVGLGACNYKAAMSVAPPAKGGTSGGGTGGAGGMGGAGGAGGSATSRGGATPIIHLDASANDGSGPDMNCGARSKAAVKVPPEILIVLDRSGSMNEDISGSMCNDGGVGASAGCGATSKWAKVIPAINQVVMETEADVNWGLKFFPDSQTNSCNVNTTAAVPIAPNNSGAIAAAIMGATSANGGVVGYNNTPTRSAMAGATTYLQSVTTMNPKFILLATDGVPTCGAMGTGMDDAVASEAAVAAANTAGFKTFVAGIATAGNADLTLSKLATAGGLPRPGTPTYYPVSSAADLAAAIRTFIGAANTCTFQIGPAPTSDGTTDLKKIIVLGDGVAIERDMTHANGYDYTDGTMNSIQVYGPLCDQIMTGVIHEVSVNFICLIP